MTPRISQPITEASRAWRLCRERPFKGPRAPWGILRTLVLAVSLLGASRGPLLAQEVQQGTDALEQVLFAPELIMQHRRAISLTDEQRDAISRLIQDLQGKVVGYQWELLDDLESLTEILEGDRVDLDRALDGMDQVLDTERRVKQAHLELLVRIKNVLTPEQQALLRRLRDEAATG